MCKFRIARFMRFSFLSISLCLQYKAVGGRVLLGVRWGRHQQRRVVGRSSSNQELGTAAATSLGNTKRPQPTLMGARAGGAGGTQRAKPFHHREISNINGFNTPRWASHLSGTLLLSGLWNINWSWLGPLEVLDIFGHLPYKALLEPTCIQPCIFNSCYLP